MIKFGYITELDVDKGMVRVNFTDDDIVSNLLPVSVSASKTDKYSFPFVINEQVWCLMDEQCEFGVVGGAIYSQKDKPPSGVGEDTIMVNINSDKFKLKIDRQTGELEIDSKADVAIKSATKVTIQGTTKVIIQAADTEVSGNLSVAGSLTAASFAGAGGAPLSAPNGVESVGDVKAGTISLKLHKHTGGGAGNLTTVPLP